ncbi:MAG: AMP-binding protein, partial [Desulfobacteraceae bacterium]|nr:AMP-binding protein [Desulfobacteraceae bacterium]
LNPPGVTGEIRVGGEGVARGYLNNPELTADSFPPSTQYPITNNYLYRTGDLGRWLADGNIEFLGRRDQQVKIRGFRIELGEIENSLLSHPGIKEVVVIARQSRDGDNFLCSYYVENTAGQPGSDLKEFLSQSLPDYMIPAFFIKLEKLPLTPNGKIDRKALGHYQISRPQSQTYIAPRNEIEKTLTRIWVDILDIDKQEAGIDNDFFRMGGHSLKATIMAARIHKELNVKLLLAEIFKNSTIRTLADTIKELKQDKYLAVQPAEKKEYYIMSAAQKRLYVLQQMDLESTVYNMPQTIPLTKDTDPARLENAFKKLIRLHESLRTAFHMHEDQPVQNVCDTVEFEIEYYANNTEDEVGAAFFRPFDLAKAPLLRAGIAELPVAPGVRNVHDIHDIHDIRDRVMLIDMHHIINDGTSQQILTRDFFALYAGENVTPLKIQYKDYAEWQNSSLHTQLLKQQEEFWVSRLPGELPVLDLPTDYPRPVVRSFEGNNLSFELNENETAKLKETAKENEATLYMTILTIFTILLSKLGGQEDIIVGMPTAGRRHADLENIIGMFVNTLVMRNYPSGEKTCREFLKEIKKGTLQAFDNQEYQFEDLVDRLSVRRDTGRNPIFDVMFNLLNQVESKEQNTTNS